MAGRASGRAMGRAGRAARAAGDPMYDIPLGGERTPSPEIKFIGSVLQKSPATSPEDSSNGSPSDSPTPELKSARLTKHDDLKEIAVVKSYGTSGEPCNLVTNYVKVNCGDIPAHMYHVEILPLMDNIKARRQLMLSDPVTAVIGKVQAFSGGNLYLPHMLPESRTVIKTKHLGIGDVTVTVVYVKDAPKEELIPFFNTLLRRAMSELKLVEIKHIHYDPMEKVRIPTHKLELWPGFVNKILRLDQGLLLCCEVTHRVLRMDTALEILKDIFRKDAANFQVNAKKYLCNNVVLTKYNNKPYRIDDIDFTVTPLSTFTRHDGSEISYRDYFQNHWNETIEDLKQPMLVSLPKPRRGQEAEVQKVILVPELCVLTGLTQDIRNDNRVMRDIATHTRVTPDIRIEKLRAYLRNLKANPAAKQIFDDWKISLEQGPFEVPARVFRTEKLIFGKGPIAVPSNVSWNREALQGAGVSVSNIDRWAVIVPTREDQRALAVVRMIAEVAKHMGFTMAMPTKVPIETDNPAAYVTAIREAITPAANYQIVLLLTPGSAQREDRYNAIKRMLCCDLGIPSQVLRMATVGDERKARSVAQKVALQMQCKIGGQPWLVPIPFTSAMFVGIDVYHDPNRKAKSCVAMVASMNSQCGQWYSRVYFQASKNEIAETLQGGILSALKKYREKNDFCPEKIFIYRDGVGDGDIESVHSAEIPQITMACNNYCSKYDVVPQIHAVIVQKRVDSRMFARGAGSKLDNPPPGTVMDRGITRINFHDFFLISQHVTQGAVTPTYYIVVQNDSNLDMDKIQRLTYRLSLVYYNWTGAIRVPAVCQYAHKIAYLAGQNLTNVPKESLCDRLFYL